MNDSLTSYFKFNNGSSSILQIQLLTSKKSPNQLIVSKKYLFTHLENPIVDLKNQSKKLNLDSLNWTERETWEFNYSNDTIRNVKLSEYGTLNQIRVVDFKKDYCSVRYYWIKNGIINTEPYAYDSINFTQNSNVLKRTYFRWEEPIKLYSKMNQRKRVITDDTTLFRLQKFYYNEWDFNDHIISMMAGEGAIYHFEIIEFESQLVKFDRHYKFGETKVKRKLKNQRLVKLIFFKNGVINKSIEIEYT